MKYIPTFSLWFLFTVIFKTSLLHAIPSEKLEPFFLEKKYEQEEPTVSSSSSYSKENLFSSEGFTQEERGSEVSDDVFTDVSSVCNYEHPLTCIEGRTKLSQLANGEMDSSYGNISGKKSLGAIAIDLDDSIKTLDEKIEFLKTVSSTEEVPNNSAQIIEYLELYKEALKRGSTILSSIKGNKSSFITLPSLKKIASHLESSFTCYEKTLNAIESEGSAQDESGGWLVPEGWAFLKLAEEEAKPKSEEEAKAKLQETMIALYKRCIDFFQKAEAAKKQGHVQKSAQLRTKAMALLPVSKQES